MIIIMLLAFNDGNYPISKVRKYYEVLCYCFRKLWIYFCKPDGKCSRLVYGKFLNFSVVA